jgi:hypothetical protein
MRSLTIWGVRWAQSGLWCSSWPASKNFWAMAGADWRCCGTASGVVRQVEHHSRVQLVAAVERVHDLGRSTRERVACQHTESYR